MSTIDFEIEIPKGYYTKEELENHIKNNIFKIVNTKDWREVDGSVGRFGL